MWILTLSSALAADLYVAPWGDDGDAGTFEAPFATINRGTQSLSPGDTVWVRGGVYREQARLNDSGAPGNPITLRGYPGETAVVDGEGIRNNGILFSDALPADYVVVEDFTVRNAIYSGVYVGIGHRDITLRGIEAHDVLNIAGIYLNETANVRVDGCHVHDNAFGIYVATRSTDTVIENTVVEANLNHGIAFYASGNYANHPVGSVENLRAVVRDCEVFDNGVQGLWAQRTWDLSIEGGHFHHNGATGVQIESGCRNVFTRGVIAEDNNVAYGGEYGIWYDETVGGVIEDNLIRGNEGGLSLSQAHDLIVRRNLIVDNASQQTPPDCAWCPVSSGAISLSYGRDEHLGAPLGSSGHAIVHNTVVDNGHPTSTWGGLRVYSDHPGILDNVLANNVISGQVGAYELDIPDLDAFAWADRDLFWNTRALNFGWGAADMDLAGFQLASGHELSAVTLDPAFVNAQAGDYALQSGSPAADAGMWLTQTVSGGSGTVLPVVDARFFSAGLAGLVAGDSVVLQGELQLLQVQAVDRDLDTVTVDRAVTWSAGAGVTYPFYGPGPDLGALERCVRHRARDCTP